MSEKDSDSGGFGRGRRRRLGKSFSSRSSQQHMRTASGSDQIDDGCSFPFPNDEEIDSLTFLSCAEKVIEVISRFDSRKRDIIESIGFGGLFYLPRFCELNKSFSVWIMNRIKWYTSCLNVSDKISLTIYPDDIGKITGLSYSGADISDSYLETTDEKLNFRKTNLSFLGADCGIVEAAESYVQQKSPNVMSKDFLDNFKVAFVIFVMGRFLAPSTEHPDGNTNFWGALKYPDAIHSFNWSSYVLANIMDASRLVNWVIPCKKRLSTVGGCTLIMQIFYLDNIDFGELNLPHDMFPRWKIFSYQSITAMIQADTCFVTNGSTMSRFGRKQVVRQLNSCYSFTKHENPTLHSAVASGNPQLNLCSEQERSYDGIPNHNEAGTMDEPLPTIFKSLPNFDADVLDFGSFVNRKYQGKVDPGLLDDLKVHNAKCLMQLSKSYRALAASIVNENTNFAIKLIEQYHINKPASTIKEPESYSVPRRRTYKDFRSGTDSSTEGEENPNIRKNQRIRQPPLGIPESSKATNNSGGIILSRGNILNTSQDSSHKHNHDADALNIGASCKDFTLGPSTYCPSIAPPVHPVATDKPSSCTPCAYSIAATSMASTGANMTKSNIQMSNRSDVSSAKIRHFDTPEATIKMSALSPQTSPRTANKIYAGVCVSLKMLDSLNCIDLNTSSVDDDYSPIVGPRIIARPGSFASSHWSMNIEHPPKEAFAVNGFLDWISCTTSDELDRDWIIHKIPRFIKISGKDLKDQFALNNPISFDIFDASIRRLNQLDKDIYPADVGLRWRHLLESDYAIHVLGDENPTENKHIRDQFVGPGVDYDLAKCRMFFVPVFVHGIWWCYAWDLKHNVVFIIDHSTCRINDEAVIRQHSGTIDELAKGLSSTIHQLFIGWSPKFRSCRIAVIQTGFVPYNPINSGIMTLFCIRNFDGSKLLVDPTEINLANFRSQLLYELMEIRDNSGSLPTAFVQIID